jgi:surface antigen
MYRFLLAAAPLLLMSVQAPVQAKSNDQKVGQKCEPKKKKSGGMFGSIAGSIAGTALGRAGVPTGVAGIAFPVSSLITDVIASKLTCKEQVQAATATTEATRGGVGTTSTWTSQSRENVQGSSTVVAQNNRNDGASCMQVNDVVIVNGEETTVSKTMCRAPGASGYTLAA